MSRNPLVSIVLPTYNGGTYLETSIQSCLDQQYQNWELIIVDDASTDHTPNIIEKYVTTDKRIRSIRHETNQKLPGALNSGFFASKGMYLTWTSDDNLYRPNALAEMVQFLEENPETGLVYADYTEIDETGQVIQDVKVADYLQTIVFKACVAGCFLYRRNVYETVGEYSLDLYLAEDYDYWLRVASHFTMYPLHRNLYMYRQHKSSLTTASSRNARWLTREKAILQNLPNLKWLTPQLKSEAYLHLVTLAWDRHERRSAARYYLIAVRHSPWTVLRRSIYYVIQIVMGKRFADILGSQYVKLKN